MISRLLRWSLAISGGIILLGVFYSLNNQALWLEPMEWEFFLVSLGVILIGGLCFYVVAPFLCRKGRLFTRTIEEEISRVPTKDLIFGGIGLILGLMVAYFAVQLLLNIPIPILGPVLSVVVTLFLGYLGARIGKSRGEEIDYPRALRGTPRDHELERTTKGESLIEEEELNGIPKVLDTSVIIDGRILDISKTQFLEGPLIVPEFILEELRRVADSDDSLKRNRGRRGLDILHQLQEEKDIQLDILSHQFTNEYEKNLEVDVKLLKVAQQLGGRVVTNDYNLNKVAEVQGVSVLNINDLANAVKAVVIPGEEMEVHVVKAGKEKKQGLAYLDDGTMIVVEDGQSHIGKTIGSIVTSVLQTSAGRMIFVKPK